MSTGLVYILTNPCLDGWVKIGMTEKNDVTQRLKELNQPTNIPLSYLCYATYEVENPRSVEQSVHRLIDEVDLSLHAIEPLSNGRFRRREFFKLTPENAFSILKEVATLRGDLDKLKLYEIEDDLLIDNLNFINNNVPIEQEEAPSKEVTKPIESNIGENSDIGKRIEFRKIRRRTPKRRVTSQA